MRGHGLTRLALKGPGRMPAQAFRSVPFRRKTKVHQAYLPMGAWGFLETYDRVPRHLILRNHRRRGIPLCC